jgi:hypothetical protein
MEEEFEVLLSFLNVQEEKCRILVWHSQLLAEQILERYSNVELYVIKSSQDIDVIPNSNANISYYDIDLNEEKKLPFQDNYFDYIILGRVIEQTTHPEIFIKTLYRYLSISGKVLASFGNIRHWTIINNLMSGIWKYEETGILQSKAKHSFVLKEIAKLFEQAHYQELQFAFLQKKAPKELLEKLENVGFENENGDLEVTVWIVKACKADEVAERLKKCFSEEVRRHLMYLLRRLEGKIDLQKNGPLLWQYCVQERISIAYLVEFIQNTMLHPLEVITTAALGIYRSGSEDSAIELLRVGAVFCQTNENLVHNWLVAEDCITAKVDYLQSMYTASLRKKLSILIRRIENDIDIKENCQQFWQLCQEQAIDIDYVTEFIDNVVLDKEKVIVTLSVYAYEVAFYAEALSLLREAYKKYKKIESIVYTFSLVLSLMNEKEESLMILEAYDGADTDILQLREDLRRKCNE